LKIFRNYKERTTIRFSIFLLIGFLLEWWFLYFSGFNIPKFIPNTPIDTSGLLLLLLLILSLKIFIKKLDRQNNAYSIFELTLYGTIIGFIAEFVFQVIRILINSKTFKESFVDFISGLFGMTFFSAVISFLISYHIKTRKTGMLFLFIFLSLLLIYYLKYFILLILD